MTACYRYDGTLEGFLCALALCLASGGGDAEFLRPGAESGAGLFAGVPRDVATEREAALRFRERFVGAVSRDAFATLRYAFHSEAAGVEDLLWRYVLVGLKEGKRLERMLAQEPVCTVNRLARTVSHEAHKFTGFVRFREVAWPAGGSRYGGADQEDGSFLYARIEPAVDILAFIAPFFTERLNDRDWMIHDLRRSQAAVFNRETWRLVRDVELTSPPGYTAEEEVCSRLWRSYFQRMAIPERHNPRLQQQLVPLRFRAHLVEFGGEEP